MCFSAIFQTCKEETKMNKIEVTGCIEMCADKIIALSMAIEDVCPLYTEDRGTAEELERMLNLVFILREQASKLKIAVDALDAV